MIILSLAFLSFVRQKQSSDSPGLTSAVLVRQNSSEYSLKCPLNYEAFHSDWWEEVPVVAPCELQEFPL